MPADPVAEANRLIAYHSAISKVMTAERTSLESALIPVTAYILVSAAEAFFRHPEMVEVIDAAMPAEEIGRLGRRPGSRVNAVHLWSIANIYLIGRKFTAAVRPDFDDPRRTAGLLRFWERAALAYRGDGHRQAWDAGFTLRPYGPDVVAQLVAGVGPVTSDDDRSAITRLNAALVAYLFLLYFDTRVGAGDSGPYPLSSEHVLLVRDYYDLARNDFPWSDVGDGVPYRHLTAALVLENVDVRVDDWGTSRTTPDDYLRRLVGFGLFTTDSGTLTPVPPHDIELILREVRVAQSRLYRRIAGMSRGEKIAAGASVYFTFLRPFAVAAGVAGQLEWSVPLATSGPLYEMLQAVEGTNTGEQEEGDYYRPYPA